MLKIILTCGLYPQIAIADEHNNYKRDSDQCFHSKVSFTHIEPFLLDYLNYILSTLKHKSFVILHPTSIFAYDPDILQPCDDGIVKDKLTFSTRHQLLVYVLVFASQKVTFEFAKLLTFPILKIY